MREVNGWYMPSDDYYFDRFIVGKPRKQNGFQREHLLEAFDHVKKWDVAVDVGAHVGFWATDMAEKFDTVYCFEPSPNTFACLAKNMVEHDNVMLAACALGAKEGWCNIAARDAGRENNSGSEYIIPDDRAGHIRVRRLDDFKLPACDLLKIDVEGYEFAVLMGAKRTIESCKPVVIMECKKFRGRRFGWWAHGKAESFLIKRGYREVAYMRPDKVFVSEG